MTMEIQKFTWGFSSLLIIVALFPAATCHLPQCSFAGINLEQCLDQAKSPASIDSCCNALNQVIQAGYYCLCAILGSSSPLITTSLLLPLPNCFISVPPLTQCREPRAMVSPVQEMKPPPTRPVPVFLPPQLPSVPKDMVLPLPPNMDNIPVVNTTRHHNRSIRSPAILGSHPVPELKVPKDGYLMSFGGDGKKILMYARVLLLIGSTLIHVMLIT